MIQQSTRIKIIVFLLVLTAIIFLVTIRDTVKPATTSSWIPLNDVVEQTLITMDDHEPVKTSAKININTATVAQLDELPGIGPAKAQAIVADRQQHGRYTSLDQLLRVKGIGPKMVDKIKTSGTAMIK